MKKLFFDTKKIHKGFSRCSKNLVFDIADTFLVLIIINILLHYFFPIKQIIFSPYSYIGALLFIIGWIPNIWIYFTFRRGGNLTPSKETPNKLITSGFFRLTRNPNYLGMIIALLGEAIFLGSIITFIIPIVFFILINVWNVAFEEEVLERKFGKRYLEYKKKVRRWI